VAARIELHRASGSYRDRLRSYRILIDGERAGSVKEGQTASVEVPPGRHEVELRIAWCRSPAIAIDVADRATVSLRCCPNRQHGALAAITAGRRHYIALESSGAGEVETDR
jgi:hypothetical protein